MLDFVFDKPKGARAITLPKTESAKDVKELRKKSVDIRPVIHIETTLTAPELSVVSWSLLQHPKAAQSVMV